MSAKAALGAAMGRLEAALAGERERWALWLPVCLGLGVALYFALAVEPPLWLGAAGVAAAAVLGVAGRRRPVLLVAALGLGVVGVGFAVVQWRAVAVAAPMLEKRLGPTSVSGRVVRVETFPGSVRVTLERPRIGGLDPDRTPRKVRLRLRGRQPALNPGDWIRLRGVIAPPPAPAAPGAFDFQRQSFFRGLGGVGFAYGAATVLARGGEEGLDALWLGLARVRQHITQRVLSGLEGPAGAVAAALMTGERSAIPPAVMAAVRDSGLAHLLAISGLHIGLVAGILFFGLRGALALVPPLALRYPIKKWAAAAAIPGAFAYALVAGATVPSQRAFLMIGLVLLAVLLDRRGLSMRTVAWAAVIILLLHPESLLGASFQLSFAAVTALIAGYEVVRGRRRLGGNGPPVIWRRILFYVGGVALTTLIAGAVTAPFAAYHFNRLAAYGLAANLIAVPVTALWIMPWAVAAFLLLPLGLERVALMPLGWGVEIMIRTAETVAAWPGAVTIVPAMPMWGLACVVFGGLWLCLWRRPWRLWGAVGVAVGLASVLLVRPPDVLVDGAGKLLAVRAAAGELWLSSLRTARFSRETWLRRVGQETAAVWPREGSDAGLALTCDGLGCIYRAKGQVVALVRRPDALLEDCAMADVIVAVVPVRRRCPSPHTVIDRFDLWRKGGHALWLEEGGARVETVNGNRGNRPWVVRPKPWKSTP